MSKIRLLFLLLFPLPAFSQQEYIIPMDGTPAYHGYVSPGGGPVRTVIPSTGPQAGIPQTVFIPGLPASPASSASTVHHSAASGEMSKKSKEAWQKTLKIQFIRKYYSSYTAKDLEKMSEADFMPIYKSALRKEATEKLIKSGKGFPPELDMKVVKPFDVAGSFFKVGAIIHVINISPDGSYGQTMVGRKCILRVNMSCCEKFEKTAE